MFCLRQVYHREQRNYDKIKILPQLRSVDAGGVKNDTKKFIKELMATNFSKNRAEEIASAVIRSGDSYEDAYVLVVVAAGLNEERKRCEQNERN